MSASRFRLLPPSAAPLYPRDILAGLKALGDPHEALNGLRETIRTRFGVRHVFFATSGRAGLSVGLHALRRLAPERDEVLLPAYTSFSVPSAAVNAGLRVSLYDLHPETMAPDMESLEAAMGPKTLCVVACHLFGYPVDLAPIQALCRRSGAFLFDDAAQAMGARIGGRMAGTMGDVGLFSLSRGKNMTAVDGGIVLTDRDNVAEGLLGKLQPTGASGFFRRFATALVLTGMLHPRAYWLPASLPFLNIGASIFDPQFKTDGLDVFRVGLAKSVLGRLDALNKGRKNVASALLACLEKVEGLQSVRPMPEAEPVFLRLPVLPLSGSWPGGKAPEIPAMGVVRSYPQALQDIEGLKPFLAGQGKCPMAAMLARNILTLPTHAYVRDGDVTAVEEVFKDIFDNVHGESICFTRRSLLSAMEKKA